MNSFRSPTLFALTLLAFSLAPLAAHAGIPFFGPIIPAATNQCAAGWGLVMTVINNVISFLLTIVIVFVAPLMIAYSGFLFVVNPVNASGKEQAKKILLNTVVGIVLALASWMIVDAVMAVLYNPGAAGGTWSSLVTSGGPECLTIAGSLHQATTTPVTPPITVGPPVIPADEQSIRAILKTAGVDVPKAPCVGNNGSGCTTVANLLPNTVRQTMYIAQSMAASSGTTCNGIRTCLELTGGTEPGHSTTGTQTHANGYKVDIRPTTALNDYIKAMTSIGTRGTGEGTFDGPAYRDSCGNIYVQEVKNSNLWDITVTAVCGSTTTNPPPGGGTTITWPPGTLVMAPGFGHPKQAVNVTNGADNYFSYEMTADQIQSAGSGFTIKAFDGVNTPAGTFTVTVYDPNNQIVASETGNSIGGTLARISNPVPGVYHVVTVLVWEETSDAANIPSGSAAFWVVANL